MLHGALHCPFFGHTCQHSDFMSNIYPSAHRCADSAMLRSSKSTSRLPTRPPVAAIRSWASCAVSQVTLHHTSTFNPQSIPHKTTLPGSGLVDQRKRNALQCGSTRGKFKFVAYALRELTIDAGSLPGRACRAGRQSLEFLVEFLCVEPVLERESRTAVHDASRDCRDGEREREDDV
jgi:hypothetical protein